MSTTPSPAAARISSFVLMIILVILASSLIALFLAINSFDSNPEIAGYLLLFGFLGVTASTYVLWQARKRIALARVETPPTLTTIECKKCGFKSVREFQRGDYIFKELDPCQKCNEKMMITSIYREFKEKPKERFPF